jgi:hypothetical protein
MRFAGVLAALLSGALVLAAPAFAGGKLAYSAGAPSQIFTIGPGGGPAQQMVA